MLFIFQQLPFLLQAYRAYRFFECRFILIRWVIEFLLNHSAILGRFIFFFGEIRIGLVKNLNLETNPALASHGLRAKGQPGGGREENCKIHLVLSLFTQWDHSFGFLFCCFFFVFFLVNIFFSSVERRGGKLQRACATHVSTC